MTFLGGYSQSIWTQTDWPSNFISWNNNYALIRDLYRSSNRQKNVYIQNIGTIYLLFYSFSRLTKYRYANLKLLNLLLEQKQCFSNTL